jgi:predicted NAD/FAD-binding protein
MRIEAGSSVIVVGAGAAGLTAAHFIGQRHRVVLVEAKTRLGGHAWTYTVPDGPDRGLPLDLGFMVLNDRNYPTMSRLLQRLGGITTAPIEMSFGFSDEARALSYLINVGPDARPRAETPSDTALRTIMSEIIRFQRRASRDLESGAIGGVTLGRYLDRTAVTARLRDDYLLPMGAAIWSVAANDVLQQPAEFFLWFFRNHGLLSLDTPPQWRHMVGGAGRYVDALVAATPGLSVIRAPAMRIERGTGGVVVTLGNSERLSADYCVVAVHADDALGLLDRPSAKEQAALSAWRYRRNHAVLHCDPAVMPADPAHWASWNCRRSQGELTFSYHLNRLQNHRDTARQYFLTLASEADALPAVSPENELLRCSFTHPMFSVEAVACRHLLTEDTDRTFFCGSYFGNGFHEDAIASGLRVGSLFGAAA